MRASDHQHYRDDAESEKRKKKLRKQATWRHLHCGAIQLGKSQQKGKRKLGLINLCERENKLPSVWKIITPQEGNREGAQGSGGVERDKGRGRPSQ